MNPVNVLVVGSGAREDALARRLKQSPQAGTIYVAPGNPGTEMWGCKNVPLSTDPKNFEMLAELACHLNIGLAVIGPDNALADGIVRIFKNRGIRTFGPELSWVIEADKVWAKLFMRDVGIPTAPFSIFINPDEADRYVSLQAKPQVVKAYGLALGKGVRTCDTEAEAKVAIDDFMRKKTLGKAGDKVVIEDKLDGDELSIHFLCDGVRGKMLPPCRDHKRLTSDPKSDMTGGMGVCGPIKIDKDLLRQIQEEIVDPCITGLAERNMPFVGCLYPGLMLTKDGPKVLEFNARFGDPETQVYMNLLDDSVDLIEVLLACIEGRLDRVELKWKDAYCRCVVLAAEGYPKNPRKGDVIEHGYDSSYVYHGGTAWIDGKLRTNGGRVINVVNVTSTIPLDCEHECKRMAAHVHFKGKQFRTDIGANW